jgi:hypothetical protein
MDKCDTCKVFRLSKELGLYHVVFKTQYLMNMHFWRDAPILSGKSLTLIDFMEEYVSKSKQQTFKYTEEYEGSIFDDETFKDNFSNLSDENKYDKRVKKIHEILSNECEKYNCIITFQSANKDVFLHEFSHYLYNTNKSYKNDMTQLIKSIDKELLKKLKKVIRTAGYTSGIDNEIQAYLATGFSFKDSIQDDYIKRSDIESLEKKFNDLFKRYKSKTKIVREHISDL